MNVMDISANHQRVRDQGELFGIEIEVENVMLPDTTDTIWSCIEDGSLRNSGFEFVSRPCDYDDAIAGIAQFYKWNDEHGYVASVRTSTHVHYNVLGYTLEELAAALTAYSIVEPILFRYCGRVREENVYCVPWYRAPDEARIVQGFADNNAARIDGACKYSALYLEPVLRFGTVEFRHAPVFSSVDSLRFWIDLVRTLMRHGQALETGALVIEKFEELGANLFVESLFGPELSDKLKGYCEDSYEEIIDEADSMSVAIDCLPYTYKVTGSWDAFASPEGEGQVGYHTARARPTPMYEIDEPYPEDIEEDYHEEEY